MNNLIVIFEDVKFMEFYSKKKIEKASLQVKKYFFQHAVERHDHRRPECRKWRGGID